MMTADRCPYPEELSYGPDPLAIGRYTAEAVMFTVMTLSWTFCGQIWVGSSRDTALVAVLGMGIGVAVVQFALILRQAHFSIVADHAGLSSLYSGNKDRAMPWACVEQVKIIRGKGKQIEEIKLRGQKGRRIAIKGIKKMPELVEIVRKNAPAEAVFILKDRKLSLGLPLELLLWAILALLPIIVVLIS